MCHLFNGIHITVQCSLQNLHFYFENGYTCTGGLSTTWLLVFLFTGLGSKYAGLESKPQLSDLMKEVASKMPVKWKEISIQLGLTLNDQKCFIDATSGDPNQCFTFVFNVWRNQATRPYTWSTVIQVLEAPAVDETRLAWELRTKLQSKCDSVEQSKFLRLWQC